MFALVCGEVSMCKIVHDPVSLGGQPVLLKGERIQSPPNYGTIYPKAPFTFVKPRYHQNNTMMARPSALIRPRSLLGEASIGAYGWYLQ